MLKWLLVMVVAVIVLGFLAPRLQKFGLGKLPGDVRFRYRGRDVYLPITSTILVSAVLTLVLRYL
jgi:hypothetical protein